jgi:hypothetical protein
MMHSHTANGVLILFFCVCRVQGAFREVSLRTRDDGWVLARQSCGREVYALVDGRLSSILDAQQAFDVLVTQCFANVHVP